MKQGTSTTERRGGASNTMQSSAYKEHSIHQFSAHSGCQKLLDRAVDRWAEQIIQQQQQQQQQQQDASHDRRPCLVDLGSADGSNSMQTIRYAIDRLHQSLQKMSPSTTSNVTTQPLPLTIIFEEHPASDESALRQTLASQLEWFQDNQIKYDVLMKSFYGPLVPPGSVDLFLSYICLHWLDTASMDTPLSHWKWLTHNNDNEYYNNEQPFVFINERTAPSALFQRWRQDLARVRLAHLLVLRARELRRDGGQAVFMMVGHPHEYVRPMIGGPSALTRALTACVERGVVQASVLQDTIVPYFQRTTEDVRDALELARIIPITDLIPQQQEQENDITDDRDALFPASSLELVDLIDYQATTGLGESSIAGACDLFWAIHKGAVQSTGKATPEELEHVRLETHRQFEMLYQGQSGIKGTFVACVVRRQGSVDTTDTSYGTAVAPTNAGQPVREQF